MVSNSAGVPSLTVNRVFTSLQPQELEELNERASELDSDYVPTRFASFFFVEGPEETELERPSELLAAWPLIEIAEVDQAPVLAALT